MPKVSIITICYNEPNLEQTCESIVSQTWQNFEWIVIDGGSNEETQQIWNKYKYRIDKFISEPDTGIYNACNKGIKLATGEYLNFMNAGDSFYSNHILEKIFSQMNFQGDILYGDTNFFQEKSENDNVIRHYPKRLNNIFWISENINTQSLFIKSQLFEKYGYFSEQYFIASDFERWLCFNKNHATFVYIPFVVANFNLDGISFSAKQVTILDMEKQKILNKYFSQQEIKILSRKAFYSKYSLAEHIFSIKNDKNNTHKVITILGIHIKMKRRHK